MQKERLRIQLWRSPTASMHEALSNLYSSTVHHAVPRLRIILDYARSCINACTLSVYYATYASTNEQGKMCGERWWGGEEGCIWGSPFVDIGLWWIDRRVNSEMWLDGRSVILVQGRVFSANGGTVRYKSTLERTRDGNLHVRPTQSCDRKVAFRSSVLRERRTRSWRM